mmetsp:Transcript_155155/g.282110  ORF Transcript_155155/g.282110 Transcript_155155/m.282110 type:complete len:110 (-) Transcript_155155:1755-2084(-)
MASRAVLAVLFFTACINVEAVTLSKVGASKAKASLAVSVNPIRKVVNLLKGIETKVNGELEAKEKLYDEYMCYCKNSDGTLAASIAEAEGKIPKVASNIESDTAKKSSN